MFSSSLPTVLIEISLPFVSLVLDTSKQREWLLTFSHQKKMQQNQHHHLDNKILMLALVSTLYDTVGTCIIMGEKRKPFSLFQYPHLNSEEYRNTCYRLKVKKFPPFQMKYTCDPKTLTMRKHSEFVSTCWEGRINTQLPKATAGNLEKSKCYRTFSDTRQMYSSLFQYTDRKCGRIRRARQKREESHTDYKGIPIPVV